MFQLIFFSVVVFTIVALVFVVSLILAKKVMNSREKASPFECGFDKNNNLRLPFSLRFFLITIIFLIFDVEIVLLLPSIGVFDISLMTPWVHVYMFFIIALVGGVLHEWNQGMLDWSN